MSVPISSTYVAISLSEHTCIIYFLILLYAKSKSDSQELKMGLAPLPKIIPWASTMYTHTLRNPPDVYTFFHLLVTTLLKFTPSPQVLSRIPLSLSRSLHYVRVFE